MIFKQNDPAWGHIPLGYGPDTIGESGCLLTADAQVLLHYGFSVNPSTLNDILKGAGRYISGDLLGDAGVSGLPQFPGVAFVTKWDFTTRPADLSVLTNNQTDEYIIEVDFDHNPNDGIQTHFVRFVSYVNGVLIIDDPEFGTEDNFTTHYGPDLAKTILKIVKYTGPVAATAAPSPAPAVPTPVAPTATSDVVGTAIVLSPANVRTGPGTEYPINADHTPNGKLSVGVSFPYIAVVAGGDPYNDGRNQWVESEFHNYIWGGNLTLEAGKGGSPEPAPAAEAPAPPAPVVEPVAPPVPAASEVQPLDRVAWLTPTLNDVTKEHEGAPVIDLDTSNPIAVVPTGTKVPFVAFKTQGGVNYLITQNMIDSKLNHGINGLNLQETEAPTKTVDAIQAAEVTPEAAAAAGETTVEHSIPEVGPIWTKLLDFVTKHHK